MHQRCQGNSFLIAWNLNSFIFRGSWKSKCYKFTNIVSFFSSWLSIPRSQPKAKLNLKYELLPSLHTSATVGEYRVSLLFAFHWEFWLLVQPFYYTSVPPVTLTWHSLAWYYCVVLDHPWNCFTRLLAWEFREALVFDIQHDIIRRLAWILWKSNPLYRVNSFQKWELDLWLLWR